MSLFSRLFGGKKRLDDSNNTTNTASSTENINIEKKGNPFFTNAPHDWPVITDEFIETNMKFALNYDGNTGEKTIRKRMFMNNSLLLIGAINAYLRKKANKEIPANYLDSLLDSTDQYATSFCIDKIFKEGIIKTNGVVIDNYERYAVMLFDEPVSDNYINKLRELYIQTGFKEMVYYAVNDPKTITAEKDIEFGDLTPNSFNFNKDKQSVNDRKHSEYAVWWPGADKDNFISSEVASDMNYYLSLNSDCSTYLLGQLSFAFKIKNDNTRVALPDYDEITIEGPEGVEIIMTISNITGINFHFPVSPVFEDYRNNFIKMYIRFSEAAQQFIRENNYPKDNPPLSTKWFSQLIDEVNLNRDRLHTISLRNKNGIYFN